MKTKTVNLNSSTTTPIAIKADPALLKIIDDMRRHQPDDVPSRTQMIVRAIKWAYEDHTKKVIKAVV